ncbi:bis-triphosphatase-like protein [Baffinella frigidus]|nr:bis-triphosphatase-like protein [Cryptophyta sp. CCMP2293]
MRGGGSNKEEEGGLRFGQHWVPESHVFYRSESGLSSAIVNLRPIVPGHVLVLSSAIVPRVSDLDEAASADLWKTVKAVSKVVEEVYGAEGLNIKIQDGRAAGQSVAP